MSSNPYSLETIQPAQIEVSRSETFAPRSLKEAFEFADIILTSGMAPKAYASMKPEVARATIVVVLQHGLEVGLQPMQAIQNISSINGNPAIWGDAALALCYSKPHICQYVTEMDLSEIKQRGSATCKAKRRDSPTEVSVTFTMDDAKTAGLLSKESTWGKYPSRMLQLRARGFALRNAFPDIMKGMVLVEEARDYPIIEADAMQSSSVSADTPATQEPVDEPIGAPLATKWYKAYTASGWNRDDAAVYLKGIGIEPPLDSRSIPTSKLDDAMAWAETRNPEIPVNPDAE